MKLLDTDGAWIAIGISVFFIFVGFAMKRVFVTILKQSPQQPESPSAPSEIKPYD
jgi:hypothetical protein